MGRGTREACGLYSPFLPVDCRIEFQFEGKKVKKEINENEDGRRVIEALDLRAMVWPSRFLFLFFHWLLLTENEVLW